MPEGKAPHFPQQPVARQNDDGSLELECFLDASPQPDIKWFYDNKEVKQDSRFQFKLDSKGNDSYSAILQIKDLADSDAGGYRCAIVNPHGKGNANFNLELTGFSSPTFVEKPQISSRDDGQVMVMEFRAKSILKPTFVWHKGDKIVAQSDRVNIVLREEANQIYYAALEIKEPTKEKDTGQFICMAKNDSGKLTATFTVKFEVPQGAPTFTRKPQILQVTSESGDPAIVIDIGYQADRNPEACAATMLYRNRSNVPLRPFSKRMDELKRWNHKRRLERMLKLSLPDSKFGSDDRVNTPCNTVSFEEFVYDLSQAGPSRRNLLSPDLSQGQEVFPVQVYSDTPNCDPPGKFACISSNDFSSYGEPEDNEGIALGNPQRTGLISL